jgi:flagellar basal body P-ring formation protein FlgA
MNILPSTMRILHFLHKAIYITPLLANFVAAQSDNNLAQIQLMQNVEQYVVQQLSTADVANLSVNAMPLDARIEVPECPQPLTISASDEALQQANITVKASCESSGWYLFLMVKAVQMQNVATLSSAVSPGTLLTRSNVEIVEVDKKLLRTTTFADIESVLGARVKRRLQPGQPINPNQLCFVCKGDNIVISAGIQGLSIRTSGVAEQDGNIGDTIRVRNLSSDKVIAARVVSVKNVEVSI